MSRRAPTGPPAREQGTVYQLHLDPPLGQAKHDKDMEAGQ